MQPSLTSLPTWLQITLAVIPSVSALFAAAGLFLNIAQARRTSKQARAALVAKFLSDFANDDKMQNIFYRIEYGLFQYDKNFHGSEEEARLDRLLLHFANLALAWKYGLLENDDILPVQYIARRLLRDDGVRNYLGFVKTFADIAELGGHPYQALQEMGALLGA